MASCSGDGSRGHHRFTLNVDETYVSGGAENYSTVSWSLVLSPIQTGWDWNYSSTVPVSYRVIIDGTEYTGNIMSYDGRSTVTVRSGTQNITHNNDGSKSINFSFSVWDNVSASYLPGSASGSGSMALSNIPRYTNITSFTVSKRNETSVSVSFTTSDEVDYIWYSKDNGSNWADLPISNIISGLSPDTTYNFKIRVRRRDSQLTTDSNTVSQTTYKVPTQSLNSKTETSIKMNWSCDTTANYIWYSKDNGSTWTAVGTVNAKSGRYTISGLTANTTYNIKTRVRRSSTNTTYDTTKSSQTTYSYPYCTDAPDFTIGNNVTLKFYNPLNRTLNIQMYSTTSEAYVSDLIQITGTSYTGFSNIASRLYASIPNSSESNYNIEVTYGSNKTIKSGNKYKVKGTETPTFSDFTYIDSNSAVTTITGDNQVMVKGLSTVQVTISSANKMVAQNGATGKNYTMTMSNLSATENYSENDIVKNLGEINESGSQRLTVTAFDSRGLSKAVYKDITVYDYSYPKLNVTLKRLNNFEDQTTLKISGKYTTLTINNVEKNYISSVQYRYRDIESTFNNWTSVEVFENSGSFSCNDIVLSLDNTKVFEFEVRVTDALGQTIAQSYKVDKGQAIFFISTNEETCYVYGKEVAVYDKLYPVGAIYINSTNTNPATFLGGTWELIDKEFKARNSNFTTDFYTLNTELCSSINSGTVQWNGHTLRLLFTWTNASIINDDALTILQLALSELGITRFGFTNRFSHFSDGGQVVIEYGISDTGEVQTRDIMRRGSSDADLPAGANIAAQFMWTIRGTDMLDSFCDKFYWKRTS